MNSESIDWDEIVKAAQEMRGISVISLTHALCEENTSQAITKEDCIANLIRCSKARTAVESGFSKFKIYFEESQPE